MTDTDPFIVEALDDRPLPRRRRRYRAQRGASVETLPQPWRALLVRWIARGGRSRWETLAKEAGAAELQTAQALLDWLVRQGWARVEEARRHGDWWPVRVELIDLPTLRTALGLPDEAALAEQWRLLREALQARCEPLFAQAVAELDGLPPARALARGQLLAAAKRWHEEERSGTRRDFALYARGSTKAVTDAEWFWLETRIDLSELGIERHTPLLLIAAPLTLITPTGRLELAAGTDFCAITPATVHAARQGEQSVARWRLVENRTSFERLARAREADTGVVWLPGFAPTWWREAMARLIALAPAPAEIACDPDPAGIEIALDAGRLWEARGLPWRPWRMAPADIAALPHRAALTPRDRERLAALDQARLPKQLAALAQWMLAHGEKGEQEGLL
ncbi:DUF2399 domain-containing protein [Thiobacter aerophilum]|uniref:DUF2399 domain-containing protein n=1 Tax=Thiobacter aerophilum TaxID=3121275 RepID=A0ABV0EFN5_9BURK